MNNLPQSGFGLCNTVHHDAYNIHFVNLDVLEGIAISPLLAHFLSSFVKVLASLAQRKSRLACF